MQCVARRIVDRDMLRLIKMWLRVPVEERDENGKPRVSGGKGNTCGTPQGGVMTPRTQKVTWGRRGSGSGTGVRSARPGGAGLRYGNGMAQRDRLSVDENLLHQESKDLLALS